MDKFSANSYYKLSEGLMIYSENGETLINIKAPTNKSVEKLAKLVLNALNTEYFDKMAKLKENEDNFNMGLIGSQEKFDNEQTIINS